MAQDVMGKTQGSVLSAMDSTQLSHTLTPEESALSTRKKANLGNRHLCEMTASPKIKIKIQPHKRVNFGSVQRNVCPRGRWGCSHMNAHFGSVKKKCTHSRQRLQNTEGQHRSARVRDCQSRQSLLAQQELVT